MSPRLVVEAWVAAFNGDWAILEWQGPKGLRGCGFFQVIGGKTAFQRGYWDKLSILGLHGLEGGA